MDKKFQRVVTKIFKTKFRNNMSIDITPQWDSMNFLLLISELEKLYKKKVKDNDIVKLNNVKRLYDYFKKK